MKITRIAKIQPHYGFFPHLPHDALRVALYWDINTDGRSPNVPIDAMVLEFGDGSLRMLADLADDGIGEYRFTRGDMDDAFAGAYADLVRQDPIEMLFLVAERAWMDGMDGLDEVCLEACASRPIRRWLPGADRVHIPFVLPSDLEPSRSLLPANGHTYGALEVLSALAEPNYIRVVGDAYGQIVLCGADAEERFSQNATASMVAGESAHGPVIVCDGAHVMALVNSGELGAK